MNSNFKTSFNPGAKLNFLRGRYPFSLFVSLGLIALAGVGFIVRGNSSKNPVNEQSISLPQIGISESVKPTLQSESVPLNYQEIELQIIQLKSKLAELENGISTPKTLMEKFAVNLCEYHGGNDGDSDINPCMNREYFQRQAKALAPHYETRIEKCLSAGKGNACLKAKTYLTADIDAQTQPVEKADIATGICKIIFNPNRC